MIDAPAAPSAYEQVLTQKMIHCGLHQRGFTVKYERELQSVEIVIGRDSGATAEHVDCIRNAAGHVIVTFEDPALRQAYDARLFEALRPKMLADARDELEKHGALDGFPERSTFDSDKQFAEALERHCGMKPGSFFIQSQWGLVGLPKFGRQSKADKERSACLTAAIMYVSAKGETFKFGFIGNEAVAPER